MPSVRTIFISATLVLLLAAACGLGWFGFRSPPQEKSDLSESQRAAAIKVARLRDESLAALENRDFAAADPQLIDLGTSGIGEPIGARNWLINRLLTIESLEARNSGKIEPENRGDKVDHESSRPPAGASVADSKAYVEAVERARTALMLEWSLERENPLRYYLGAKFEGFAQVLGRQLENLHTGAGRWPDDAKFWQELYRVQRGNPDEAIRTDGENALRMLHELVPDNLYVLLEWMHWEAARKAPDFGPTLDRARPLLLPFLDDVRSEPPVDPSRLFADASTAAKKGDWKAVERNINTLRRIASVQPAVRIDRRRVEPDLMRLVFTDFSQEYYREHPLARTLPGEPTTVRYSEVGATGPLSQADDVLDARFYATDAEGTLGIAVLRKSSFEIYRGPARTRQAVSPPTAAVAGKTSPPPASSASARPPAVTSAEQQWTRLSQVALPNGGFDHVLVTCLDRDAVSAGDDFVLYGRSGVLVIRDRTVAGAATHNLQQVESRELADGTKGAQAVTVVDLDEDGNLDLIVLSDAPGVSAAANHGAISIWRNTGHLRFVDITRRAGLPAQMTASRMPATGSPAAPPAVLGGPLIPVDWNHDGDIDLLLTAGEGSAKGVGLLKGAGAGRFHFAPIGSDNEHFRSATAIAVLDADANGSWDVLAASPSGMVLLRTASVERGQVKVTGTETVSNFAADGLLVLDYDNDGCQDVVAWNRAAVRVFHGDNTGNFEERDIIPVAADWRATSGESSIVVRAADGGDFDGDGDLDLLFVTADGAGADSGGGGGRLHLLRNDGGNKNNWIDVQLDGGSATAVKVQDVGTNPAGIGSTLQLKAGTICQSQIVSRRVTHFGIGALEAANVLRIVWPGGVASNHLDLAKNRIHRAVSGEGRGARGEINQVSPRRQSSALRPFRRENSLPSPPVMRTAILDEIKFGDAERQRRRRASAASRKIERHQRLQRK